MQGCQKLRFCPNSRILKCALARKDIYEKYKLFELSQHHMRHEMSTGSCEGVVFQSMHAHGEVYSVRISIIIMCVD